MENKQTTQVRDYPRDGIHYTFLKEGDILHINATQIEHKFKWKKAVTSFFPVGTENDISVENLFHIITTAFEGKDSDVALILPPTVIL